MDVQRESAQRGAMSQGRVLWRLVRTFLPQFPLLFLVIVSTAGYTAVQTARVALLYPAMRVFDAPADEEEGEDAAGEEGGAGAEEKEAQDPLDLSQIERTLMKGSGKFSEQLKKINRFLDGMDQAMISMLDDVGIVDARDRSPANIRKLAKVGTLGTVLLFFAIITIFSAITNFLMMYSKSLLVMKVLVTLRVKLLENLLHQPLAFYNDQKRGELITRMGSDVAAATVCFQTLTGGMLQQPFLILMAVTAIAMMKWWLAIFPLGFLIAVTFSLRKQTRKVHRRAKVRQRTVSKVTEAMIQMFSGIRVVKAFGLEDEKVDQYHERNRQFSRDAMATEVAKAWTKTKMELLIHAGIVLVLAVALSVIGGGGELSSGVFITLVAFLAQLHRPAKMLTRAYSDLQDNLAGAARAFEFLDMDRGMADRPGAIPITDVVGTVRFEDVSFAYNGNGKVLKHINLEVPAGEVVALVGHSGAGKSTLVNLVPRFYDPNEGKITLDGTDIRELTRASLLRNIAVVTQEPFLFNATVRENIAYGRPGATMAEIEAAAKAANIHEFIMAQPRRYETVVGERGGNLSGGQLQRITIARALLRDARILILDEATSNLDSESENAVQKALQNLMQGRTTLVIAHRLSTIQHADKIVVMQDGEIAEVGSHDQLMGMDSHYRRLYQLQFASE